MSRGTSNQSRSSTVRRRDFLKAGGVAAAAFGFPMLLPRHVLGGPNQPGANGRIRLGAIGVGGRARLLLTQLPPDAQLVALAECNLSRAEKFKASAQKAAADKTKINWDIYQNHHKLLERKDIDGVIIATADFQRVSPCIDACVAGKDVYAEKPLTLYIHEGRVLVEVVRKHNTVFQVGSQQRSMNINRVACELIRTGGLGKVKEVRAFDYGMAPVGPKKLPSQPMPKGLNWDVWLNQLPDRPYNESYIGGWHGWREFGGGLMTNWGAHGVDQIQWALGTDGTGPVETWLIQPGKSDQVGMRYANGVEIHFILTKGHGPMGGAVFVCEKGKLEINRNKFSSNPKEIAEDLAKKLDMKAEEAKWSDTGHLWNAEPHIENWLDCMRSRKMPVADVEIGHRSISICHLANITRLLGRKLTWDPAKELFVGDDEANRYVNLPRRKEFALPSTI